MDEEEGEGGDGEHHRQAGGQLGREPEEEAFIRRYFFLGWT
ncbi:hypothetical protein [Streptomyces sp. TLI_171]|nr:hypothetical protein [Streptomyces sp. TLI_171]